MKPVKVDADAPRWNRVSDGRWVGTRGQTAAFELSATGRVHVWMRDVTPLLVVRCEKGHAEAFVYTQSAARMEPQDGDHTVQLAFDGAGATSERSPDSAEHDALFARNPQAFTRQMTQSRTLHSAHTPQRRTGRGDLRPRRPRAAARLVCEAVRLETIRKEARCLKTPAPQHFQATHSVWQPGLQTRLIPAYQFILTPKRTTRGATIAWIWLAFEAFCVPRIACTVLVLARLNTSSDGVKRTVPMLTGRSTCRSMLWSFGSARSPTLLEQGRTVPGAALAARAQDALLERIALARVVESRHVELERQPRRGRSV